MNRTNGTRELGGSSRQMKSQQRKSLSWLFMVGRGLSGNKKNLFLRRQSCYRRTKSLEQSWTWLIFEILLRFANPHGLPLLNLWNKLLSSTITFCLFFLDTARD
jgi:hypothetical protein